MANKGRFQGTALLFCLAMIALHRTGNGSPADLLCRPRSSPGQAAEKPFGGDPFPRPVSCRCVEGTDERRASIIMVYYTKACPPCQGNRKTESPCPYEADLVALPKASGSFAPHEGFAQDKPSAQGECASPEQIKESRNSPKKASASADAFFGGAGKGSRTLLSSLGSLRSTDELYLR